MHHQLKRGDSLNQTSYRRALLVLYDHFMFGLRFIRLTHDELPHLVLGTRLVINQLILVDYKHRRKDK